ncbi:MAG: DUF2007 domain-containing protein [Planctomycetes bacterium]|nr:DUF2007 domain-containing protein [Planctomycetota bacterium]
MKQCVIYKADASAAAEVLKILRRSGISAVQVDNANPIVLWASKGTYHVRIAVPEDQAPQARSVLADWERSCAPRADRLAKSFGRQAVIALVIAVVISTAHRLLVDRTLDQIDWGGIALELLFLWFVTLAVLANLGRLTRKQR